MGFKKMLSKKLSGDFPAQQFNTSPVSDVLKQGEINIIWFDKIAANKIPYDTFNDNFKLFLTKMSSNHVKKYVSFVFNKGIIFTGFSKIKNPVFSRLLITKDKKVAGIVLDAADLDISIDTGETLSVDNCIYATYYSLVRSAILLNKNEIMKDKELHKNLVIYLNQIFLKSLGKGTIYNDKQRDAILVVCAYIFHRHYLEQKHTSALSFVKRNYTKIIKKETLASVLPQLESTSKYNNVQHISKILIDLKIISVKPNAVVMNLFKFLGTAGMYNLIGSLDTYIGLIVLSRYPTGLFPRTTLISDKLHKNVEDIIVKYIDKVEYSVKAIKREY